MLTNLFSALQLHRYRFQVEPFGINIINCDFILDRKNWIKADLTQSCFFLFPHMGHCNKQQRVLSVLFSSESDSESDSRVPTVTSINCIFDRITCFSITTVKINRMLILDSLKQCGSGYNRGRKFFQWSSLNFN